MTVKREELKRKKVKIDELIKTIPMNVLVFFYVGYSEPHYVNEKLKYVKTHLNMCIS